MGLLDDNRPPVGNLRAFKNLRNTEYVNKNQDSNVWAEMWKHRGGFPFKIASGAKTGVVFLTDVQPLFVHELAFAAVSGPKGHYPGTDYVRSMTAVDVSADGEIKMMQGRDSCLIEEALGRKPRLMWVAKILDLTPFKRKDGTEVKMSVKSIYIPSSGNVIEQLTAVSEITGKDMQYAMFSVQRSNNDKAPRIGDSWTYRKHTSLADIMADLPDVADQLSRIDINKGFPILTDAQAIALLRQHKNVAAKFPKPSGALIYDAAKMAKILNEKPAIKPTDVIEEEPKAPLKIDAAKGSLESLEDIPDGDEFNLEN
jgi:hypothetical protein